jgi:superfamily II DNA/RNA helicase
LLFSATMPPPIKKLADKFLSNPKSIEVARPASSNLLIEQRMLKVDARRKKEALERLLRADEVKTAMIFCNRKTTVRELAQSLKRSGFKAGQIHGDMEQPERIAELDRFKREEINILCASDVAARGLDIKGVSHVFNYDVPWHPDDYVHRIGRTGRAGRTGIAITLVTPGDQEAIDNVQTLIGTKITEIGRAERPAADEAEQPADEETPRRAARPRRERRPSRERAAPRDDAPEKAAPRERAAPREEAPEKAPPRERAAPRAEAPAAAPPRARAPRREPEPDAADDGGWNGPVPSFLGKGFGG